MDGDVAGEPVPSYLWNKRGVVPFLKVDKGLEAEQNGVQLMKAMPELDALLIRGREKGMFGTKMRSVIAHADQAGIAAVVKQQFEVARRIIGARAWSAIVEPEVSIKSPTKVEAEAILRDEIAAQLEQAAGRQIRHAEADDPDGCRFLRSAGRAQVGGSRGCPVGRLHHRRRLQLSHNHGMIASFSLRALAESCASR